MRERRNDEGHVSSSTVEQPEDLEQCSAEDPRAGPRHPVSMSLVEQVQHWADSARKLPLIVVF
jgi:hypothetical protein